MADDPARPRNVSRRRFLLASGAVGTAAIAGCTQSNPSGGSGGAGGNGSGGGGSNAGSGSGSGQLSGTIDIAGSSTVFPLATAMAERFMQEHPEVKINIQSTGSGGGFENFFCPGETDFNNASRPIAEEEKAHCRENDVDPVELNVATDALTIIANNEADWVDCVTTEELKQIWSADSPPQQWSDVNPEWPDEPFDLYGPTEASGTYDYFNETIIGEEGPGIRGDYQATEQDRTIIQGVSQSESGLGFLGYAYYSENKDVVKALAVDDGSGCVEPSLQTAKNGNYEPLSRPLFTYPAKSQLADPAVAEFAKFWIENATSQEIVAEEVGYIPLDDGQQRQAMNTLETAIEEAQGGSGSANGSGTGNSSGNGT
jgi:phosphate transport system substrate-binding protein